MPLNLEQVNIDKAQQYLEVITNKKARSLATDPTVQRFDEIEDEIVKKSDEISKLGRSLIRYPIKKGDIFSSTLYNAIIQGIDDDVRVVATSISKITTILNKVIDTLNRYHQNLMAGFNEGITEIRNIEKLSESTLEFNDFISDSFTSATNDYQFREAAENTEDGGLYTLSAYASDKLVGEYGDAYINVQVLNDNITILNQGGNLFERHVDEAFSIIGFAEQPASFIGDIAGTSVQYDGMLVALIITMPAKRLANHISFSQFSSSPYEIFGMYKSNLETTDYKSSDWERLTAFHSDSGHKGSFEFNMERDTYQSLMIIFGQSVFKSKTIALNPDEMTNIVHNIEDPRYKELFDIKKVYQNALLQSGMQVTRKDEIKYKQPSIYSNIATQMRRFLDYYLKLLKPQTFITQKDGFLYDVGLYKLLIKYKEYRSFSIFESSLIKRNGNIITCQLAKTDYSDVNVFIKYFVKFESLTKRLLGAGETTTNDLFIVSDSLDLTRDLDFFASPPTVEKPILVYVNGELKTPPDYSLMYADVQQQVIQGLQFAPGIYSFGDVVKVTYTISKVDANYNQYTPHVVDMTKEIGIPNLRENLLSNPQDSDTAVIVNPEFNTFTYIPAAKGTTVRRGFLPDEDGAASATIGWYVLKDFAIANLDSSIFDNSDEIMLGAAGSPKYYIISGENVKTSPDAVYRGVVLEPVPYAETSYSGPSRNVIHTKYKYTPGTVVVRINNKNYYTQEYTQGETDLTRVVVTTKNILPDDKVFVSYVPIDVEELAAHGLSNISEPNKFEVFAGTLADSSVLLGSFPYIDFNIVRSAGEKGGDWLEIENRFTYKSFVSLTYSPFDIQVGGILATDKTNYGGTDKPELDPFLERNYQFYVEGNRLYFNTYIDPKSGKDISVRYYTLGSRLRLRAELFRNNLRNQSVTPEMYDYTLLLNIS